mmetsp:Transcript_2230/g.4776  ORF Transcript_2230/g.4776 Transcript_2230/m.4776 type:complete len:395 (-) Transcript_2230:89-1273(-)|eukprot:CAMPEP_0197560574 /NCGR_PEP_ID=MMETSP1320-20131121/23422_1 /TAXON_ID=91990 /ORGANISM="Bolidomonas sp., Strain RCC2347" /LENGTH=394 /DNA_ID=CAMNT_0043122131 /DNA_START=10 /DNA_END=1194 /DNA_ORIENTATION=+
MKFTALALAGFAFASVDAFSIHKYPSSFAGARATPGARTRSNEQLASPFRPGPLSATVGVVGATGAVGKEILGCLENRAFPVDKLRIFGSARSAGSTVKTKWGDVTVELFDSKAAAETDVCFLAVSGDFALEHAKDIAKGSIVIDNSSAFRYMPDIPLVVPEINGKTCKGKNLIANPNCTTAIGLMALDPLMKKFGAKRVIMSTYQASSGAGQEGMDELKEGTIAVVSGERDVAENKIFAHPLPFNVIPHIDKFQDNGYTKEEMKVTWETRKICGLADDFPVSCTAVRIPTYRAHSESIVLETEKPVDVAAAQALLDSSPGVKLVDDIRSDNPKYPMPLTATGQYDVEVGRVRRSEAFGDYGLEFFVSGDQLLRGAALNAVLVAEECIKNGDLA